MSNPGFDRRLCQEIHELASAALCDELTDDECKRLEAIVCQSASARRLYLA